jgi:hypothetical protein
MNKKQILGLVRHILTFAGGILLAKGYVDESLLEELTGSVITIVGAVLSIKNKMEKTTDEKSN